MRDAILISLIDDDQSVRESIPGLLRVYGYEVRAFESAEAFLESKVTESTRCLVLDVTMPGMSGPELFEELKKRPVKIPVIFVTAHGSIDLCKHLISSGAIACLQKPFSPMALVEALQRALA